MTATPGSPLSAQEELGVKDVSSPNDGEKVAGKYTEGSDSKPYYHAIVGRNAVDRNSPSTFAPFSKFPFELRRKVWKDACFHTQMIDLSPVLLKTLETKDG